ncbi:MAG: hypothetical protein HRT68_03745 [Flavobacteriaceae bacterium]|nr:hypothetical protein [Flavobacteriaceae bacterium]
MHLFLSIIVSLAILLPTVHQLIDQDDHHMVTHKDCDDEYAHLHEACDGCGMCLYTKSSFELNQFETPQFSHVIFSKKNITSRQLLYYPYLTSHLQLRGPPRTA